MAIRPCACFLSGAPMGPAQMLHQRIYDADVCLRRSGDADGGGADRSVLFCAAAQRQAQKRLSGTVFCSAWEMVKGFDAGWADFCPAKPCLPSSIYGILNRKNRGDGPDGPPPCFSIRRYMAARRLPPLCGAVAVSPPEHQQQERQTGAGCQHDHPQRQGRFVPGGGRRAASR